VTAVESIVTVLDEGIGKPAETPVEYVIWTVYVRAMVMVVIGTAPAAVIAGAGVEAAGGAAGAAGVEPAGGAAHLVQMVDVEVTEMVTTVGVVKIVVLPAWVMSWPGGQLETVV